VVGSSLLSRMMNISSGFSRMVRPQKPSRLCLFEPLSSLAAHVVVVRLPTVGLPSRVPVPCCMLATVTMTVPKISWSQAGSRDGSRVPIGGWPVMWVVGAVVIVGVCRPMV